MWAAAYCRKIALDRQYLDTEKAESIVGLNRAEQKFEAILGTQNADTLFNEVVWDDELQHDLESHCLLQHLDQHGDYLVSEERKLTAETFTIELHSRNMAWC